MNSVYEFMYMNCINSEFTNEFTTMNHKYMNSDIKIQCIQSVFMNLIDYYEFRHVSFITIGKKAGFLRRG